jgi:glycosyltransferase involved in cell wall biosynthesis
LEVIAMTDTSPTIIVLNDYCHVQGGASRVAIDEAVALAASGCRVIFLGANDPICDELRTASVEVHCLHQPELLDLGKNPRVIWQGLWNRAAAKKLREILQPLDPSRTLIHLHGYTKALTTSPVRCAHKMGFKLICTLHDFYTACPNGAFFDFQKRAPCPKRGLSVDCMTTHCDKRRYAHKLYRVARSCMQKYWGGLPSFIKHYIALSENSVRLLKPYLPRDSQFYPLENISEMPKQAPVNVVANQSIVIVGRLDIEKGIETVLEAAKATTLPLVFVGDGPLRPQVEATPNCRVTGWVDAVRVRQELQQARCLIFPSIWYETYGLVVAEAAALGVPAIVSSLTAAAERVTDGIHGWHMPAGDSAALAKLLRQMEDPETVQRAGQAAYERFWQNPPTRQYHVDELLKIYRQILA